MVIAEALTGWCFIVKIEKQDDRKTPQGDMLHQKK
jgi:hypothetical protein